MATYATDGFVFTTAYALNEGTTTYNLVASAELLNGAMTTYYQMIGWSTAGPPYTEVVWVVTGNPDLTGAYSGLAGINASSIRILRTWTI